MIGLPPAVAELRDVGWEIKRIPEVAFFQEGPGLRNWQFRDSGMKIINGRNILPDGSIVLSNTDRHMDLEEFSQRYSHFAVEEGDIVVASSGAYGKVGRIRAPHLPLMMNTSVVRFHPHSEEELNPDFLMYFLISDLFQDQIELYVTGTAQKNFGPSHIKQMWIPVPPISTQRKIADILSAYDDLIENNTRRIAILEEMAQRLYQEWFVHFRYPGHENVPLVESELGLIPEGWEVRRLGEVIEVNPRTPVPRAGLKPFVPMASLAENSMLITDVTTREGNSGSKFQNGDTLLARITPCLENGKTAFVQFLATSEAVAFGSTEFIVLRSISVCPEFVYLLARSDEFRRHAIKSMSGATGRQRVQDRAVMNSRLVKPVDCTHLTEPRSKSTFLLHRKRNVVFFEFDRRQVTQA